MGYWVGLGGEGKRVGSGLRKEDKLGVGKVCVVVVRAVWCEVADDCVLAFLAMVQVVKGAHGVCDLWQNRLRWWLVAW